MTADVAATAATRRLPLLMLPQLLPPLLLVTMPAGSAATAATPRMRLLMLAAAIAVAPLLLPV